MLVLFWLFTDWTRNAFDGTLWPVLGWFFLPWTTIAYMTIMLMNNHQVSGMWVGLLILGVILDLGSTGGGGRAMRGKHND